MAARAVVATAAVFAVAEAVVTPAQCEGRRSRPAGQQRSSEGRIVMRRWRSTAQDQVLIMQAVQHSDVKK